MPGVVKKELCEGTLQDLHARFHIVEGAHNLKVYGVDMQLPTACYNLNLLDLNYLKNARYWHYST